MVWRTLLQKPEDEFVTLPWVAGRELRSADRTWRLEGQLPNEIGWYRFKLHTRTARLYQVATPDLLSEIRWHERQVGYLVGDRLVPDSARVDPDPKKILQYSETVYLLEEGLDRFVRVSAGRIHESGPLIFIQQEMPLGPEASVLEAYLDQKPSVDDVKDVAPALDAAFRMESWQRAEAERRRQELERLRQEEEEKQQAAIRMRLAGEKLGTSVGRRQMAVLDFAAAARSALAISGAEYLDHRRGRGNEMVVRFRLARRRFECVCDAATLRILESGICLTDSTTGERGDDRFVLEDLPAIIQTAIDEGVLHVFRHVD